MKTSFGKQLREGLVTNNPIFVQFLGMCSALAITTSVTNAIGMGLSVTAVLICSNLLISLLRRVIMPQVRIAAFIVIISGFVTAVELLIKAYLPSLDIFLRATGKILAAADGSGGIAILGSWYSPANIFILPPGAFLTLAFLVALFQKLISVSAEKKEKKAYLTENCAEENAEAETEESDD